MDTNKLRGIIAERGLSQRKVDEQLGMTERTFYSKMKRGVFGTDEAQQMVDILQIENPADIFLSKE